MKKYFLKRFCFLCVGILILWVTYLGVSYYIDYNRYTESWNNAGAFGDMFGGFNALVSGLAFAGLIVTIWQQKESLEIQQSELLETRKELQEQTKQFRDQVELNELNQRRTEIYQHLERLSQLVNNIEYKDLKEEKTWYGYAALKEIFFKIQSLIDTFFPTSKAQKTDVNLNDLIKEILKINDTSDVIEAWMRSFENLARKICKDFPQRPDVGSFYLNQLLCEIPFTCIGLLYLYHDTVLNMPIIEELRTRDFISSHKLGGMIHDQERRKIFLK